MTSDLGRFWFFSQEERNLSTQEAIISIQEIFSLSHSFFTVVSLPMAAAHILPRNDQGSSAQAPDGTRRQRGLRSTRVTHAAQSGAQVQSRSLPGGTGTRSTRCLHGEGGHWLPSCCHWQSRSVRKRKYYHLPDAGEERKKLLGSLIRPKCKTWAVFSIYPLFFSLSLGRWFQALGTTSAHIAQSTHSTLFTAQHGPTDNSPSVILCNYL